jgi:hypothetical protein
MDAVACGLKIAVAIRKEGGWRWFQGIRNLHPEEKRARRQQERSQELIENVIDGFSPRE